MLVELCLLCLFSLPIGFCYQCGLTREVSFFYEHHVDQGEPLVVPCEPPIKKIGHSDRGERFISVQWLDERGSPVSPSSLTRDNEMTMKPAEGAMSGIYCCLINYESVENVLKNELYVHSVTVYSRMPPNSNRCRDGFETKNGKCVPCLPGHYGTGGLVCSSCPLDTYSENHFATTCQKCPLWKETVHDRATLKDCYYPLTVKLVVVTLLLLFMVAVVLCLWCCFCYRHKRRRKAHRNRRETSRKNFAEPDVEKVPLLKGGSESENGDRTRTEQQTPSTNPRARESPAPPGIEWSSYRDPSNRSSGEEDESRPKTLNEGSQAVSPSSNSVNGDGSRKSASIHENVPVDIFNMGDDYSFFSSNSSGPDLSASPSENSTGRYRRS